MKTICNLSTAVLLAAMSASAWAQYLNPRLVAAPRYTYAGGVLASADYTIATIPVPAAKQYQYQRTEQTLQIADSGLAILHSEFLDAYSGGPNAYAYGHTFLGYNHGPGLLNGDYVRVQNAAGGTGPVIAHKTAVRGDESQWGVWAYQVNLGPGAKAGFWIGSDNAPIQGREYDTVPNVMVIAEDLHISDAAIQHNAPPGSTAAVLRVLQGGQVVAELLENGTLRVKRIEMLP